MTIHEIIIEFRNIVEQYSKIKQTLKIIHNDAINKFIKNCNILFDIILNSEILNDYNFSIIVFIFDFVIHFVDIFVE